MSEQIINLPFMGFYESWYDGEINREIENVAYNAHGDDDRLTESEYADLLFRCTNFSSVFLGISMGYVDALNDMIKEETGLDLGLKYHRLVSPREYNFTTDQIDAFITVEKAVELYDWVSQGDLASVIRDRHTSRSGFISFYSNDVEEWLAKPLDEWDHNELCTLITAFIEANLDEEWEYQLFSTLMDDGAMSTHFDKAVDWEKFDTLKAEELAKQTEEN